MMQIHEHKITTKGKMKMKKWKLLLATIIATAAMSMTAFAGQWKQDGAGWWYQNDDGSYAVKVMGKIGNYWYYFDATGYMKTGNYQFTDGWYSFREDGTCSNPTSSLDGTPVGGPAEGWIRCNDKTALTLLEIADGRITYFNGMYWSSPDYVNNLKEIANQDTVTRTPTNTLQPGTIVDFDKGTYTNSDDDE